MKSQGLLNAKNNTKQHYKMYKAGTKWLFAGISVITLSSVMLMGQLDVQAATKNDSAITKAATTLASGSGDNPASALLIQATLLW